MGIYLNPGNVLFQYCLNSKIYVDKTELISYTNDFLNTEQKYVCVSRPRRFGKSMALKMLAAYYDKSCDSSGMFRNLKIGKTEDGEEKELKNLNQYDVLFIDMQGLMDEVMLSDVSGIMVRETSEYMASPGIASTTHPLLRSMQRRVIEDIREDSQFAGYIPETEVSLVNTLQLIYKNTGRQFILLIDEWDSILRNYEDDTVLQDKYIDMLRGLFKNAAMQPVFALVYMTGILPVKRYGTQSALNNFKEYTFLNPGRLSRFSGFTENEVAELCEKYKMNFEKMSAWYNGYLFKRIGKIYNPRSVVCAVEEQEFSSYWTSTGTYESIRKAIEMNFDGLRENVITLLGNGRCRVDTGKFHNDMVTFKSRDDVLTFLIHLGYLGYDSDKKEVYIPNKEIRDEFVRAIEGKKYAQTFKAISDSETLLSATLEGDADTVAQCIEKIHRENTAILTYNNENSLSCVIQLAYYYAREDYMFFRELPAGKGFADIVFLPRKNVEKPAIVIELKWDKSAKTALLQVKNKEYGENLKDYCGEILLVGINYDRESKKHECVIEKCYR